uniref:Resistance to inhibitors of cholinesterase protein 3 N-terminal domain-containing protein n=1 Tax=Meloidogyne enterolobii TaxID=390850 RepID=A0A6V7V3E5_MELEN|nr:unnamed protein product [Meloidogyne enterolobii]
MSDCEEYKNKIGRKTKKRRKMEKYYDEEYEDFIDCKRHKEELLPKWKLYAVCAAVFMCFALLYPSVFAPMINSFFGRNSDNKHSHQPNSHFPHPEGHRGGGRPPHAHPAAAASMHAQARAHQTQAVGGGGGRGGFAWLLPFYTIGVVLFLLYTLFKKKKKHKRPRGHLNWEDEEEDSEDESSGSDEAPRKRYKLKSVQERLRKTEKAMNEILSQLELIATNKEVLNEGEDKSFEDENRIKEETQNMEESLEKLKKLSAIYKKNEQIKNSFRNKCEYSEEEEGEGEEINKEDFSTSSEEDEMSELEEEIGEENDNKNEDDEEIEEKDVRKRR